MQEMASRLVIGSALSGPKARLAAQGPTLDGTGTAATDARMADSLPQGAGKSPAGMSYWTPIPDKSYDVST